VRLTAIACPGDPNQVAAALNYLSSQTQYFGFDDEELVVTVAVDGATNADAIAAHVGRLPDLEKLIFSRTDLTDTGLGYLSELVSMKQLWIGGSRITSSGLAHLGAMADLEALYIENASLLDIAAIEQIGRLLSLRELSLSRGTFCDADLTSLAALTNLTRLSLCTSDNISGTFAMCLERLANLQQLSPGENVTDEGLLSISRLAALERLILEGPFSDAGLEHLNSLRQLSTLFITSDRITPKGLAVVAELPELTTLGLKITPLTDANVPVLARCKPLTSLLLIHSDLTAAGLEQLRQALPDCEIDDFRAYQ